jgi:hypothetical protein
MYANVKIINKKVCPIFVDSHWNKQGTEVQFLVICIYNIIIIIQFNSCLFTCKINSTGANYKVSTDIWKYTKISIRTKYKI